MENVIVLRVLVKEGEAVSADQPLMEVETQKAVSEVHSPSAGFLRAWKVKEGDVLSEKAILCYLSTTADEPLSHSSVATAPTMGSTSSRSGEMQPAIGGSAASGASRESEGIRATPAARKAARTMGVDLSRVRPKVENGRINVEDVEEFATSRSKANAAGSPMMPATEQNGWEPIPAQRLALIAQMKKSLVEIPQIVISRRLDVSKLVERNEGISFTHRLVLKLAVALGRHPTLRTVTDGICQRTLPVSVAVAMDTIGGLVAPVVRERDLDSLEAIATRVTDFRDRAERRSLRNEELRDGPFALTNLGMLGVDFFSPFVFHGQTAVLAVGRATQEPAGGVLAWFSLAVDHRVVDGAEAARFLGTLQQEVRT